MGKAVEMTSGGGGGQDMRRIDTPTRGITAGTGGIDAAGEGISAARPERLQIAPTVANRCERRRRRWKRERGAGVNLQHAKGSANKRLKIKVPTSDLYKGSSLHDCFDLNPFIRNPLELL
jgi:hypothetical protein